MVVYSILPCKGVTHKKTTVIQETGIMRIITVDNLQKNYINGEISVPALKGLSFTIESSVFISFVGPSGSGKTTLLNILGCLDVPTSGSVIIDNTDISKLDRRERAIFRGEKIGFIFQDFNLIPVLTVFENIEYPLMMIQNVPKPERDRRAETACGHCPRAGCGNYCHMIWHCLYCRYEDDHDIE